MVDTTWLVEEAESAKIFLKITPNASQNGCFGIVVDSNGQQWLRLNVSAVPEKGKANQALIKYLSKLTGLPKSTFSLIAGNKGRSKKVRVTGDPENIRFRLQVLVQGREDE